MSTDLRHHPYVNGLNPTPVRRRLLKAIDEGRGRVYFEAGQVWDGSVALKVTARMKDLVGHEWARALTTGEPRGPGEMPVGRTYYRLTDFGREALKGKQR